MAEHQAADCNMAGPQADALPVPNLPDAPQPAADAPDAAGAPEPAEAADEEIEHLSHRMEDSLPGSQTSEVHRCSQPSSNSMFSGAPHANQDEMDESPTSSQEDTVPLASTCFQFPDTVHDSRRYPWDQELLDRFFNGQMVAPPSEYEFLSSQSKNFGCLRPERTKKDPRYGVVWSLVDPLEGLGITKYLLEAIYFFHTVEALSRQYKWNGFVIKTNNLTENLYPKFAPGEKEKDIVGVVSKGTIDRETGESLGGPDGVDFELLLDMGNQASGGQVSTALPLLKIYLSITGAIMNGKRTLFGIVSVHWLLNVDFMPFLVVCSACISIYAYPNHIPDFHSPKQGKLLAQPLQGAGRFTEISERNTRLMDLLETLLLKQLSMMRMDRSGQHPRDFYEKPNAQLGAHTLFNPMYVPFKILETMRRLHGSVSNLQIIGFPNINWAGNPNVPGPLFDYLKYIKGYTAQIVELCSQINACCRAPFDDQQAQGRGRRRRGGNSQAGNVIREPEEDESEPLPSEHAIKIIPGWPTGELQGHYHCKWHLDLCPIIMAYRPLKPPSGSENKDLYMINLSGMPELVICLMRSYLFGDEDNVDSEKLNRINMEHLRHKWDLFGVKKEFYGEDGLKNIQLATSGCKLELYEKTICYLRESVSDGSMSCQAAVRIMNSYFDMAVCMTTSMIENQNFISKMMEQILLVKDALYKPLDDSTRIYKALNELQSDVLRKIPAESISNPLDFYRRMLFEAMIGVNENGQMLNSINLSNKLAIINSVLAYTLGRVNKTTENIGRGVEINPGAGSARAIVVSGNIKTEMTLTNNPNGTGKDMAVVTVNKDYEALMQWLKMFCEPLFAIDILTTFTETSVQLSCCIQIAGNEVISIPDPLKARRPCALTELREDADGAKKVLNSLIKQVFPRGNAGEATAQTTRDDKGTRQLVLKKNVVYFPLVYYCSNQRTSGQEQVDTLHAVNHVAAPGSVVLKHMEQSRAFNAVSINKFEGRCEPPTKHWLQVWPHTSLCF